MSHSGRFEEEQERRDASKRNERLTLEFTESTKSLRFLEKKTSKVPPENGDDDVEVTD